MRLFIRYMPRNTFTIPLYTYILILGVKEYQNYKIVNAKEFFILLIVDDCN